ncbi:unnamed protein product, partial [Ectocarpus sp. 6 AP-2014]
MGDGWEKSRQCCCCFTCVKCVVGGLRRRKGRGQEYLFQQPPTEGCSIEEGDTFIQRFHRGGLFYFTTTTADCGKSFIPSFRSFR